jgi:predicted NBD/HSP70 family sugar kinase
MGLSDVRRHHLSVVVERLAREGPGSRADLAKETGLTKATVSALVTDLMSRGLVEERQARSGGMGRPGIDVGLIPGTVGALGLQVDADRVAACLVDLTGSVLYRTGIEGDFRRTGQRAVMQKVRQVTHQAMRQAHVAGMRCAGSAVAVPGLVDPGSGALFVAPNLHWLDVDLTEPESALGLPASVPVTIENEANMAALAELRHGSVRHLSSFVYLSGGIGVGAGIVLDGRLRRGTHGFAGEVGHMVVEPGGRRCACGSQGCLETVVGARRQASRRRKVEALAAALRDVVHLLDPDAVVLGGTFSRDGAPFAQAVSDRLREETLGARWHPCEIIVSDLGTDAPLLGAAAAALERVIHDPTVVPPVEASRPA